MLSIVFVRHGESIWNKENRFTGWTDVDLTKNGLKEAKFAGKILKKQGYFFDIAYTSMLKRAIHTLWCILDELEQSWLKVEKSWRLNERHYGALQGLKKDETVKKYGEEMVKKWRRSFVIIPPKLEKTDVRFPGYDIRYSNLESEELPTSESLELTMKRILPFWKEKILPFVKEGKKVIISAHGNTIRAMIKFLENLNEEEIINLDIPTGIPLLYQFDKNIIPINKFFIK